MAVGGTALCRRHAGIVQGITTGASEEISLPDLDNRAPALVNWVARDLDATIQELLDRYRDDLHVSSTSVIPAGHQSLRSWGRHWKLFSHTGVSTRVSLVVREHEDDTIIIAVDETIIAEEVPPWIASRSRGEALTAIEDAGRRLDFYTRIGARLHRAIEGRLAGESGGR